MYSCAIGLSFLIWPYLAARCYARSKKNPLLPSYSVYAWLLFMCAILFVSAFYFPAARTIPSDTFVQHIVGGGFVSAILTIYFQRQLGLQLAIVNQWLFLAGVTSVLSIGNELLEFFLNSFLGTTINSADTWWDLLANVIGAIVSYAAIMAVCLQQSNRTSNRR